MKREVLLSVSIAIVTIVVVWGFVLVGSPAYNRKLSADKNRVDDLNNLSYRIEQYFVRHKKLPEKLVVLNNTKYSYGRDIRLKDPTTKTPYEYKIQDLYTYQLCTEFELSSQDSKLDKKPYSYYHSNTNWEHQVGYHCFSLEIPENKREAKTIE